MCLFQVHLQRKSEPGELAGRSRTPPRRPQVPGGATGAALCQVPGKCPGPLQRLLHLQRGLPLLSHIAQRKVHQAHSGCRIPATEKQGEMT